MRQLIVTAFVSADGVMEDPGGESNYRNAGWTFREIPFLEQAYELKNREQEEAGALLLGRRSYEAFASAWPSIEEFARYNRLPRYVVSTTLEDSDERWSATILRSVDDVAELKQAEGGSILVHGSAELGAALADAGLVDRYHLLVFPILLGAGKRLFSGTDKEAQLLELKEFETYANGVQKIVYDVVR